MAKRARPPQPVAWRPFEGRLARDLVLALAIAAGLFWTAPARGADPDIAPRFDPDIQAIFRAHCLKCHGPTDSRGGLDLSTAESLSRGSESGSVLLAGNAEASLLFRKLIEKQMPPPAENDVLNEATIATIRHWLDAGAVGVSADFSGTTRPVTDQDREFWAFRAPVAATIPQVRERDRARTPIDRFLLARLEERGLGFSPDASQAVLLRRAYLDLIGLPPSREAVEEFLADDQPDAYERLLDRLLGSPQYGERWGRHWLDVAGYTDSPHWNSDKAGTLHDNDDWLYRDYVVRAFNQDKPFDQFVTEQLAGDELVNWRQATSYSPEILDALVATGYLRTTPDWTHTDGVTSYQFDTLSRVVDHVSTGLLGLTMGCARCHHHKFDPIPQEDYYRLMAIFAAAYNPEQWLPPVDRFLADIPPCERDEIERQNADLETKSREIRQRLETLRGPRRKQIFATKLATLPEVLRGDVEAALATPVALRGEVQRYLALKFEALLAVSDQELTAALDESERDQAAKCGAELAALATAKRGFRRIQGLCDVGTPPALHLLIRGDFRTPGNVVEAGFPTVLCAPGQSDVTGRAEPTVNSSGRRLALARWLTSRDHPLTARVMVNRVWQHHFGQGIVATPENFGRSGSLPSHPELLDWLAVDFMEQGWQLKRLHKLIMTSTAYRQSAHRTRAGAALTLDPDNLLLGRMNLRRVEAEVLRDAVLAVSGKLDTTMGGPPIPVEVNPDGLVTVSAKGPTPTSPFRRSVYLRSLRGSHPGGQGFKLSLLELFDFPEVVINCPRRANSTTPLQSLALMNSKFMIEQARFFAERVRSMARDSASDEVRISIAFELALARRPAAAEVAICLDHLRAQTAAYTHASVSHDEASLEALASLCAMLLASNEFLYIG